MASPSVASRSSADGMMSASIAEEPLRPPSSRELAMCSEVPTTNVRSTVSDDCNARETPSIRRVSTAAELDFEVGAPLEEDEWRER